MNGTIYGLADYAIRCGLLQEDDRTWAVNRLLEVMRLDAIEAAEPELLLVCLGMGKQERFRARLAGNGHIGLMAGLGGTLDVLAGDIPRAPALFIRCRLEWLYRLLREPKRIGRVMRLPLYLAAVMKHRKENGKADRS